MGDTFFENLFYKQEKQFEKINDLSKAFAVNYCGNTIIRESIFGIVSNYARKRELALEVLRYPFRDDELWAFTFVKKGTIFLCVNTELPRFLQRHMSYIIFIAMQRILIPALLHQVLYWIQKRLMK